MNSKDTRPQGRRPGRGGRRPRNDHRRDHRSRGESPRDERQTPAKKLNFWQKLIAFFTGRGKAQAQQSSPSRSDRPRNQEARAPHRAKPEPVEVTSAKLYVGNLSYEATEGDLFELFNGVGKVQNAEVVTHKGTYKSKGFGFVTMLTVDEAKRAVEKLHDQPFMGRKLVVNGSRSNGPRD
jgi:hypothetical protein